MMKIIHPFEPIVDAKSKILILGSFPSVESRKQSFYYANPKNRFWKVLAKIYQEGVPMTIEEKRTFLLKHQIALWDVIKECEITGSSDASIKKVIINDFKFVFDYAKIEKVYANGKKAAKLYQKYGCEARYEPIIELPSTSPANATFSFDKLFDIWRQYL